MAGFQVSTYGRFWVSTEGNSPVRMSKLLVRAPLPNLNEAEV